MQYQLLHFLIFLYFLINSFCVGYYLIEDLKVAITPKENFDLTVTAIILFFLFIPLLIIQAMLEFWDWLDETFLISIFWRLLFTEYYRNITKEYLEEFNEFAKKYPYKKNITDILYQIIVKKINKLNNYTPSKT